VVEVVGWFLRAAIVRAFTASTCPSYAAWCSGVAPLAAFLDPLSAPTAPFAAALLKFGKVLPECRFGVKMVQIYTAGKPIYTGDSGRFRVLSVKCGQGRRRHHPPPGGNKLIKLINSVLGRDSKPALWTPTYLAPASYQVHPTSHRNLTPPAAPRRRDQHTAHRAAAACSTPIYRVPLRNFRA
jgi:hypothetical protein